VKIKNNSIFSINPNKLNHLNLWLLLYKAFSLTII